MAIEGGARVGAAGSGMARLPAPKPGRLATGSFLVSRGLHDDDGGNGTERGDDGDEENPLHGVRAIEV